jgi:hypothetical protein
LESIIKGVGFGKLAEKRVEERSHAFGNIFFKIPSESGPRIFYGNLINKSDCGAGICTTWPLLEGADVEISCDTYWEGYRKAKVIWCSSIAVEIYKAGLLFPEN